MKLKDFINTPRSIKRIFLLIIDICILSLSLQLSFNLRFEEFYSLNQKQFYYCFVFIFLFLSLQFKEGIYSLPSRNFNISIIPKIIQNTFLSSFALFLINLIFYKYFETPRTITILCFFLTLSLLIFKHSLLLNSFYFFKKNLSSVKKNLVILGPSYKTFSIINAIKQNTEYNFLGYVDNKFMKESNSFEKFYFIKDFSNLNKFLKLNNVTHLLISKNLSYNEKINLLRQLAVLNLRIIFLDSNINEISFIGNRIKFRPEYNDILGKEAEDHLGEINLNKKFFKKTILVTGAGGSIGSELTNKLLELNFKKLILVDVSEISLHNLKEKIQYNSNYKSKKIEYKLLNLIDKHILENIFKNNKINFIYHAAAYKHVNFVENNLRSGVKNNILITKNICELANKYNVKNNILVSTDKAVKPKNIMGLSKRICENIFKFYAKKNVQCKFIITRFGNVVGSSGSVLPIFRNSIENNLPIVVTNKKVSRYVMTIDEACCLVIKSSIVGNNGSIYVFDMGKPKNILNLAKLFINMHGFQFKVFTKKTKNKIISNNDLVPIFITKLQKGEKLHEELAYKKDLIPTKYRKLLISKEMFLKINKSFASKLNSLDAILNTKNEKIILKFLKKMI